MAHAAAPVVQLQLDTTENILVQRLLTSIVYIAWGGPGPVGCIDDACLSETKHPCCTAACSILRVSGLGVLLIAPSKKPDEMQTLICDKYPVGSHLRSGYSEHRCPGVKGWRYVGSMPGRQAQWAFRKSGLGKNCTGTQNKTNVDEVKNVAICEAVWCERVVLTCEK